MRRPMNWLGLVTAGLLGSGCFNYIEDVGPEGIIETRPGSILFDRIGANPSVTVSFTIYNRTGATVSLMQCPDRLALDIERRDGSSWTAVPALRCEGPEPEHPVSLADKVFFPGALQISETGFYRMRAVLAPGNPPVEAPPSIVFEVR